MIPTSRPPKRIGLPGIPKVISVIDVQFFKSDSRAVTASELCSLIVVLPCLGSQHPQTRFGRFLEVRMQQKKEEEKYHSQHKPATDPQTSSCEDSESLVRI